MNARLVTAVVSLVVPVVLVPGAAAATGDLTHKGCVSAAAPCAAATALGGARSVAISPDGRNAYVASQIAGAVVVFARAADGTLTQTGCISDTGAGPCTDGTALASARSVTVSPDGKNVYVATAAAVAIFARAADGALTQTGCISDTGAGPCTDGTALAGAFEVTVSPDGKNVYVASLDGDAVAVFARAANGALTETGCVSDTGAGPCADGTALDAPLGVTVSPDGKSVYVASAFSDAVAVFARAADGALTQTGCVSDSGAGPCADGSALDNASSVTVSPDGRSVYVVSQLSNAVAVFVRAADGTLTQAGCVSETGAGPCTDGRALDNAAAVTVSPDGRSVYVASSVSDAVAVFARAADGALTQTGCVSDTGAGPCTDGTALDLARWVTVSPDGKNVYAASVDSGAVAVFAREPAPAPTPTPTPTPSVSPPPPSPAPPAPQVLGVKPAPSAGAGRPMVLTAQVAGSYTGLAWDLRGDSTPEIVSGPGQTSISFRPSPGTTTIGVRAIGPGGPGALVSQTVTTAPAPLVGVARQIAGLIATRPVVASGPEDRFGRLLPPPSVDRCLYKSTKIVSESLDIEGDCLVPVTSLDQIPTAERGVVEALARELRIPLQTAAVQTAIALSDPYIAYKPVTVNGVTITPRGGAAVVIYPQIFAIASSNAGLSVGALKLVTPPRFVLDTHLKNGQIPFGSFALDGAGAKLIGALKLFGDVKVDAIPGQGSVPRGAVITANLQLPSFLKIGGSDFHTQVKLQATTDRGLILDALHIGPLNVDLGAVAVKDFRIDYSAADDEWRGQGKACVAAGACLDMTPPNGSLRIKNGELAYAGASLTFPPPGVPLFPGVTMDRIGFGFGLNPTRITGNAKITALKLYEIDGRLVLAFPSTAAPYVFDRGELPGLPEQFYAQRHTRATVGLSANASLKVPVVGSVPLAAGYLIYEFPGYVAFGGGVDRSFLGVLSMRGSVSGELNVENGRFSLFGNTDVCLIGVLCRGATGVLSSRGVGACLHLGPFSIGGGVRYDPFSIMIWPLDGCKWSPFYEFNVKGDAASAAQAGGSHTVVIGADDPSRAIRLEGAGEAPRVRVTGPDGQTLETPAGSGFVQAGALRIIRSEPAKLTVVGLQDARPGTYRIEPLAGSSAVTKVTEASDPPDAQISGRVAGTGSSRVLSYDILARPAQRVTFTEIAGESRRVIGTVNGGGRGTLRFSPAPGGGTRSIEAQFELDGLPAERKIVARFDPPSARLGRPAGLRVRRVGTTLRVSWSKVPEAATYQLVAATTGAGQQVRTTARRTVTLRQIPRSSSGRVSVRAVAPLRVGNPASARFRATAPRATRFGRLPRSPRLAQ